MGIFRLLKQWREKSDGTLEGPAVRTGVLNNTAFVDAADGAAAVQSAYDTAVSEGRERLVVYGSGSWTESLITTPDVKLDLRCELSVPSDNNLTRISRDGTEIMSLITNADHSTESSGVKIVGDSEIDFSNIQEEAIMMATVWLDNVTDSLIEGVWGHDVVPDSESADSQLGAGKFGVLLTDSTHSEIRDCRGTRCGYEGIGVRGNCDNVDVVRCVGDDNKVHSMQAASVAGNGAPNNIRFIECGAKDEQSQTGGDRITVHARATEGGSQNIDFIDCDARYACIIGDVSDVSIDGGTYQFISLLNEEDGATMQRVGIDGPTITEESDTTAAVLVNTTHSNTTIEDVTLSDATVYHDRLFNFDLELGSTVQRIDIQGTTHEPDSGSTLRNKDGAATNVEDVRMMGCTVLGPAEVVGGYFDGVQILDTALENVTRVFNDMPTNKKVRNIRGDYTTENRGSASVADGGTIPHGLNLGRNLSGVEVWTETQNRAYATAIDGTAITVGLVAPDGSAVTTAETVHFEAVANDV